jgi:hypothetical protein
VPSGFFSQAESEHLSGILFTNSGTHGTFSRIGYQTGFGNGRFMIQRKGLAYNPDPHARDPSLFSYDLEQPPFVESWGQGIVFLRNPACLHPLPDGFFPDALEQSMEDGLIVNSTHAWHPFGSKTLVISFGELKEQIRDLREARQFVISAISRDAFDAAMGGPNPLPLRTTSRPAGLQTILSDSMGWWPWTRLIAIGGTSYSRAMSISCFGHMCSRRAYRLAVPPSAGCRPL